MASPPAGHANALCRLGEAARAHAGTATARQRRECWPGAGQTREDPGSPPAGRQPMAMAAQHPVRPHHRGDHRCNAPPSHRRKEAPAMTPTPTPQEQSIRVPVLWGLAFGAIQAASPLALRWLDQATVQALLLAMIAAVYIGFAVADGRPKVIAVECTIAGAFVLLAAAGVTGPAWLLVLGYAGHGLKDFWQERSHYVAGTRWWPPFCAAVDWLVAVVRAIELIAGARFHH